MTHAEFCLPELASCFVRDSKQINFHFENFSEKKRKLVRFFPVDFAKMPFFRFFATEAALRFFNSEFWRIEKAVF